MKSGMLAAEAIFPRVTAENMESETAGRRTTTYCWKLKPKCHCNQKLTVRKNRQKWTQKWFSCLLVHPSPPHYNIDNFVMYVDGKVLPFIENWIFLSLQGSIYLNILITWRNHGCGRSCIQSETSGHHSTTTLACMVEWSTLESSTGSLGEKSHGPSNTVVSSGTGVNLIKTPPGSQKGCSGVASSVARSETCHFKGSE